MYNDDSISNLMKKYGINEIEAIQLHRLESGHDPDPELGPPSQQLIDKVKSIKPVPGQYGSGRYKVIDSKDEEKTQQFSFDDFLDEPVDDSNKPADELTVDEIAKHMDIKNDSNTNI